MYRTSLLVLISLLLAVPAFAQTPAEPSVDLEAVAVKIMVKAFQFGDYETIETLFEKLSLENKIKFLQDVAELAIILRSEIDNAVTKEGYPIRSTVVDSLFLVLVTVESIDKTSFTNLCAEYQAEKVRQTELLGRLTASLLEQTESTAPAVVQTPKPQFLPVAPPIAIAVPASDDGFITLGSYGRVYIKGLSALEMKDIINFHLTKYAEHPPVEEKLERLYYVGDILSKSGQNSSKLLDSIQYELRHEKEPCVTEYESAQSLVIKCTEKTHTQIEDLINQMRVVSENQTLVK